MATGANHAIAVVAAAGAGAGGGAGGGGGGHSVDVYEGEEPLAMGELQTFNLTETIRPSGKGTGATTTKTSHSFSSSSSSSSSSSLSVGPFRAVTLSVQSNHGEQRFTCVHRIRVLGHLVI